MYFGTPLYWRESHKQPKFLIFDSRLVLLLLLSLKQCSLEFMHRIKFKSMIS